MKYQPPFGSTDPNAPYLDRSNSNALRGSVPPAAAIEHTQREIIRVLTDRGIVPSAEDLGQLSSVIRQASGRLINLQTFTASGTYTPTAGMTFCLVEGCGGGGGGAGASNPTAGNVSLGSPGGGATSGRARFTAAQIGASVPVTIGAAGGGGNASNGGNGGTTSFGSLMSLPGGTGGLTLSNAGTPIFNGNGSVSAAASGANIAQRQGITPGYATALNSTASGVFSGPGGDSPYGQGRGTAGNANGTPALGYGAGGGGVAVTNGGGPALGGVGTAGIIIVLEYGA